MSVATMILGEPGSGKTASLRNLDPKDVLLIQALPKPLPFPSRDWQAWNSEKRTGTVYQSDSSQVICQAIYRAHTYGRHVVVIDDAQYLLANEFMRRSGERGWEKFTEIGRHAWDVMMAAVGADPSTRVYLLWHSQTADDGSTRAKTIGKMLDEKVFLEGMLTIVLRAQRKDGEYIFRTQSNGQDTCKSPMGLFSDEAIPNDLAAVDASIVNYYGISPTTGASKAQPKKEKN